MMGNQLEVFSISHFCSSSASRCRKGRESLYGGSHLSLAVFPSHFLCVRPTPIYSFPRFFQADAERRFIFLCTAYISVAIPATREKPWAGPPSRGTNSSFLHKATAHTLACLCLWWLTPGRSLKITLLVWNMSLFALRREHNSSTR